MTLTAGQSDLLQELKDVIRKGKCVAFIGSGVSGSCYHSWEELVNRLCERCGCKQRVSKDSSPEEFLSAAQAAKNNDADSYHNFLGEHFGRYIPQPPALYDIVLNINFFAYVTVNLDYLLKQKALIVSNISSSEIYAYPFLYLKNLTQRSVHYLHGIINKGATPSDGQIVLAEDEFSEAYENAGVCMNFLVPTIENEPIVFIGCGLHEPVMKRVIRICKGHQLKRMKLAVLNGEDPGTPPSRFIFLPEPEMMLNGKLDKAASENEKDKRHKYYADMDIKALWYGAPGDVHAELDETLMDIAQIPEVSPKFGF